MPGSNPAGWSCHRTRSELLPLVTRAAARVAILPGADRIEVRVTDELGVHADPERIEGVVANLLENAIKFSETGTIAVDAAPNGTSVTLSVSDHGVGIPADRLAGVFDGPQPSGASAMPSGGGLGLYLARGIVEAHGGSISVTSTEGEGATFTVVLPAEGE